MMPMKLISCLVALVMVGAITNVTAEELDSNQVECMKKPVQSEPPATDKTDTNYWTKERMKSAKPIEMPTPTEPAPVGESEDLDVNANDSVTGEGNTGSAVAPAGK